MREGKTIKHCHGKDKGKVLRTYSSAAKAKKAHAAIMANKKGK